MRYLLFILSILLPAVFAMAQSSTPEGAARLPISTYEPEVPSNTAAQAEALGATNVVKSSRTAFLMDAGVQYTDEGEYAEAERAYLRALANDPGSPDIRFRLSTLYIMMKRYKEAADILNALTEEFPGNPMTHNNLAWIYSTGGEMKNGKLALRHAREAILSAPTQASLWNTLAEAYYVLGQYDKALLASECAIDQLKAENASEKEIAEFEDQHTKILRAEQASKRLLGTDDEK
jgi:tetratricopeptide (TPR) repeat protein